MDIIYDSEDIIAIYNSGDHSYGSIIHFSGALVSQGQIPPWAKSVFSKWPGDTILISPKNKKYFAPTLVESLFLQLPKLRKPIIVLGSSMGAYAALKYSRKINADATLAFSPQYAISPHEAPFDKRRHAFYNANIHGNMAVKSSDVSGRVSVFYDPDIALDKLHAEEILKKVRTAHIIPVIYSGHDLFRIFHDQGSMVGAIEEVLKGSERIQSQYIRNVKKKSLNYFVNLSQSLAYRKKFSLASKVIDKAFDEFGKRRPLYFCRSRVLEAKGDLEGAFRDFLLGFNMSSYNPNHEDIAFGKKLASHLGLGEEALKLAELTVKVSPFQPEYHIAFISELLAQKKVQGCRNGYFRCFTKVPH
ncbi:hypothetical protein [Sulfitobacter sp. 15WGC]|uniref:hypothetical protein n=1 Tax=Sulfitobacter sp. 15WGC TaxID=2575437 RepID=UPI0010AD1E82|nr:hypothetical protein [Sulfitobacter sp. 15WGC]TKA84360.1 hypothetical protein FCK22_16390 [Sulfitobacter sp. 15WGC]